MCSSDLCMQTAVHLSLRWLRASSPGQSRTHFSTLTSGIMLTIVVAVLHHHDLQGGKPSPTQRRTRHNYEQHSSGWEVIVFVRHQGSTVFVFVFVLVVDETNADNVLFNRSLLSAFPSPKRQIGSSRDRNRSFTSRSLVGRGRRRSSSAGRGGLNDDDAFR